MTRKGNWEGPVRRKENQENRLSQKPREDCFEKKEAFDFVYYHWKDEQNGNRAVSVHFGKAVIIGDTPGHQATPSLN